MKKLLTGVVVAGMMAVSGGVSAFEFPTTTYLCSFEGVDVGIEGMSNEAANGSFIMTVKGKEADLTLTPALNSFKVVGGNTKELMFINSYPFVDGNAYSMANTIFKMNTETGFIRVYSWKMERNGRGICLKRG